MIEFITVLVITCGLVAAILACSYVAWKNGKLAGQEMAERQHDRGYQPNGRAVQRQ